MFFYLFLLISFRASLSSSFDLGWRILSVVSLGLYFMQQQELCRRWEKVGLPLLRSVYRILMMKIMSIPSLRMMIHMIQTLMYLPSRNVSFCLNYCFKLWALVISIVLCLSFKRIVDRWFFPTCVTLCWFMRVLYCAWLCWSWGFIELFTWWC